MMRYLLKLSLAVGATAAAAVGGSQVGYGDPPAALPVLQGDPSAPRLDLKRRLAPKQGAVPTRADGSLRPNGAVHRGTLYTLRIVEPAAEWTMPSLVPGPEFDGRMPNLLEEEPSPAQRVARLNLPHGGGTGALGGE